MVEDKVIPVRVALRSRPLLHKEVLEGCQECLTFIPNENQVVVGRDKAFTFDYAFSNNISQEELYNTAVADRIDYLFKGYNLTVLAYGQTGSGKTYTMGTAYTSTESESKIGVIQRAVDDIFSGINKRSETCEFLIKVSFLEVYKEDVYDLLQKNKAAAPVTIREDVEGIKVVGLTELPVTSAKETYEMLELGSLSRTTASTLMNTRSSRSHAIFTIILEQRSVSDAADYTRAKFHLVDLAGSERANKTGALGERFKEGVNINRGLLALGNVISALCEDSSHIPYRDSKLTRLLQDSLGGNSHTIMIACVSPADSNLEETVNTLRYADRARKIKNKPIVNRDPQNTELLRLRQQVQQLQLQLLQLQPNRDDSTGKIVVADDDYKMLLNRNQQLEEEVHRLTKELQRALDQTTALCERSLINEYNKEKLLQYLDELKSETNDIVKALSELNTNVDIQEQLDLVKKLQNKIIEIQSDQIVKHHEFTVYSPTKNKNANTSGLKEEQVSPNISNGYDIAEGSETNIEEGESFHLESTMKQAALSRELQELERALALKEDLAMRMKESDSQMSVMRLQYEANLKQMEEEITHLQKEKDELFAALKAAHANTNASKVSEQRRKRLKELEEQISKLKKQMLEKSKMIKIKQDAERKVSVLQQEIQSMRHARVKLLKQMKDEAERYRVWKVQKDREVAQLKQQDRKRQCQIAKMEQQYSKQQNVLKRKMEEAVAANKRLQNALQLQKSVAERRSKEKEQNAATRVKQWVEQELEIQISSKEAEHHLENLLEDRKTISRELNDLKTNFESCEPPAKKRSVGGDDDDGNSEKRRYSCDEREREKEKLKNQIKLLERDLELRNSQISSLQQKILDVQQNEKSSPVWNNIVTALEAKCALQWLFKDYSSAKVAFFVEKSSLKSKIDNMETELQQISEEKEEIQKELQEMKLKCDEKMATMARENEEKTIYFLKQINGCTNASANETMGADMMQRIIFQEHEISRLGYIHEELQRKDKECQNLREELVRARSKGSETKVFPKVVQSGCPGKKMRVYSKEGSSNSKLLSKVAEDLLLESLSPADNESETSFEEFPSYDEQKDPEWRLTPHLKTQRTRHTSIFKGRSSESDGAENNISAKSKDKSATSCSCSGNCGTKRCSCRKMVVGCSESCKCSPDNCCNRVTESSSQSDDGSDSSVMNATYDVSAINGSTNVLKESNSNMSKSLKHLKYENKNISKTSGAENNEKSIKHFKQRKAKVFPELSL